MTGRGAPAQLTTACRRVRAAADGDAVGGQSAGYVAEPSSTAEAAALLRAAAELGLTVVPRGSGSKLDWGVPPAGCDLIVDTCHLDQVIEHAAGDLVVRVQAGVRLDQLAHLLALAGQRLALDPPGSSASGGTIGGLIATGVAGPLRFRFGAPRDLLIGITVIRADGTIARSGGKVVKNVAGYDLGKLFAGSYGTLGLIAEATFRLHPRPESAAAVTLDCASPQEAAAVAQTMAGSPLAPSAVELDWPSAADPIAVSVLLEGDEPSVAGRTGRMRELLGAVADVGVPAAPFRLARPPGEDRDRTGTLLRVSFWPGQLAAVLSSIRAAAADHGLDASVSGSAAAGVLQVEVTADMRADAIAGFVAALRASLAALPTGELPPSVGSAVVLRAPPAVRAVVDMWGPVPSIRLMRAVKDQFDPEHRMAPGRFAGGI